MCVLHIAKILTRQSEINFRRSLDSDNKTKTAMLLGYGIIFKGYQLLECNEVSLLILDLRGIVASREEREGFALRRISYCSTVAVLQEHVHRL